MTDKSLTQNEVLKAYFRQSSRLTQHTATVQLGILRLSERIRELERQGWQFAHNMVAVPSRYGKARVAEYVLMSLPEVAA